MKNYQFLTKNILFTNRKIEKLAIHLPPEGGSFLAICLINVLISYYKWWEIL